MLIPTIHRRQASKGFTLIEMMIGIVVGMLVIAGVIAVYITTLQISNETIRSIKLNQELRAIMGIITTDVRRAGYWSQALGDSNDTHNPFTIRNTNDPVDLPNSDVTIHGDNCILYSYDATYPNAETDFFGFKQDDTNIRMLVNNGGPTSDDTCNIGDWVTLNDDSTIAISELSFRTTGSQCLNITQDIRWEVDSDATIPACECNDTVCTDYQTPAADDILVEVRYIAITLAGNHQAEPDTTVTFTEQVKLRNNRIIAP